MNIVSHIELNKYKLTNLTLSVPFFVIANIFFFQLFMFMLGREKPSIYVIEL